MSDKVVIKPIYQQIAIDIARRISNGEFRVGDRLLGRSTLAGHYKVSPETIRRSVILLQDMDIVTVAHGNGIIVTSRDNANKFSEKFKSLDTIGILKTSIADLIEKRKKLDEELVANYNRLLDYSERLFSTNPFAPFEIEITQKCRFIGKTIGEVKLWQSTGVTVIGIKRDNKIILSPGPYAIFLVGDIFIYMGDESSHDRFKTYLYNS